MRNVHGFAVEIGLNVPAATLLAGEAEYGWLLLSDRVTVAVGAVSVRPAQAHPRLIGVSVDNVEHSGRLQAVTQEFDF
jgi:hypothetical protein